MKKEKIKFAIETKKWQTVYEIKLNIHSEKPKYSSGIDKEGLFVKELKIVHQTNRKIVLSDEFVTLLDRRRAEQKKESYYNFLEDVSIRIKTKETYSPNGVFCTCYTIQEPEKTIKLIKRKMIEKINSEYGFLRFTDYEKIIEEMQLIKESK